jgi:uncharacterized protein with HEPN domain
MSPPDRIRLRHMIDAARQALAFASGRNRSELDTDAMLLFALVRAVEVVGEAAARVSELGRSEAPSLDWAAIVGMRNRLVHAYFDINADLLWQTVVADLPLLVKQLEATPGALGEP